MIIISSVFATIWWRGCIPVDTQQSSWAASGYQKPCSRRFVDFCRRCRRDFASTRTSHQRSSQHTREIAKITSLFRLQERLSYEKKSRKQCASSSINSQVRAFLQCLQVDRPMSWRSDETPPDRDPPGWSWNDLKFIMYFFSNRNVTISANILSFCILFVVAHQKWKRVHKNTLLAILIESRRQSVVQHPVESCADEEDNVRVAEGERAGGVHIAEGRAH